GEKRRRGRRRTTTGADNLRCATLYSVDDQKSKGEEETSGRGRIAEPPLRQSLFFSEIGFDFSPLR
ncbi:hypothetical protein U1Q18_027886, partial [Sarracenia purpurea var. burkii]